MTRDVDREPVEAEADALPSADDLKAIHRRYPDIITADGSFIFRPVVAADATEREHLRVEEKAATAVSDLKARASTFAKNDTLTLAERILSAAPVPRKRHKNKQRNSSLFDWALPSIVPERHAVALEWHGNGNYFAFMASRGIGQGLAQDLKIEITFAKLLNGEDELRWNAVDNRLRRPDDDNVIIGALLRMFWRAHDHALSLAQRQNMVRDHSIVYASGKAALAAEVYARLSDTKLACTRVSARATLLAIDAVNQAFRKAELQQ